MDEMSYTDVYDSVRVSYNCNSYYEEYRKNRTLTQQEKALMDEVCNAARKGNGTVIDIGCGDGSLYDSYLYANGCNLIGVDISELQIDAASRNLPDCSFIRDNWLYVNSQSIDCVSAIICMYAIFNFYGDDRKLAIRKMYDSLRSGGLAIINARKEMHTEIKYAEDWCGQPMWWDLPGVDTIISEFIWAGFEMDEIWDNIDNPDYVFIKFSKN